MVAALLQAFTEPVLNRVAVKRMTVGAAIREVRLIDILRFFRTVLATMPGGTVKTGATSNFWDLFKMV